MSHPGRYQAFLSYSHVDARLAQWLHGALESYRLPASVRTVSGGEIPERIGRIFKDREELAVSGGLGAAIIESLRESGALIVICSPSAARSPWVNEEIRNFKHLHGGARVFAVIASGEPFATAQPGREHEECFPPALRFAVDGDGNLTSTPAEPIAADLREHGDGRQLAKLKLVAGLTGVKLDDLVRRDAQRRAKRLKWMVLGAASVALAMSALALVALSARNEARQRHEAAEGLIEFMLVDLRKKLEPVGRLDALDVVGEKALAYYNAQPEKYLDANALGHRSRALHLIGEVRQLRGNLGEAHTAFQRAADTTEELLRKTPNDPQRIFDHAQSVFWVGNIARDRGQRQEAQRAFGKYLELAQRLYALDRSKREWELEVAYAAQNLGIVAIDDARYPDALKSLEQVREIFSRHLAAQPDLAFELAHTLGWISLAHERLGEYGNAIEAQLAKQNLFRGIADGKANKQVLRGLQNVENELARLSMARGELSSAELHARNAVSEAENLVAADPANSFWLENLCGARYRLADAMVELGKLGDAAEILHVMRIDVARLVARDSTKADWTIVLRGMVLSLQARVARGPSGPLIDELQAYATVAARALDGAARPRNIHVWYASLAEFELGRLLKTAGHGADAATHWRRIEQRLKPFEMESDYQLLTLVARTRIALGDPDGARALQARIQQSGYRHPSIAELAKEMANGTGPVPATIKPRSAS